MDYILYYYEIYAENCTQNILQNFAPEDYDSCKTVKNQGILYIVIAVHTRCFLEESA